MSSLMYAKNVGSSSVIIQNVLQYESTSAYKWMCDYYRYIHLS